MKREANTPDAMKVLNPFESAACDSPQANIKYCFMRRDHMAYENFFDQHYLDSQDCFTLEKSCFSDEEYKETISKQYLKDDNICI